MKPVIFLNKTCISSQPFCKLILKNETDELNKRLAGAQYLQRNRQSDYYVMPFSEHNIKLFTDQVSDIALVNTKYLTVKPLKTTSVVINKKKRTAKLNSKPALVLHPLQHNGCIYTAISYKFNTVIYNRLKSLAYVKFSKTYKKFVTHLDENHLRKLLHDLAPMFRVCLDNKITINSMNLLKDFWEQSYLVGHYISCPDIYVEKLKLQGYSMNTIKTYHGMLLRYLNFFDSSIEIINSYSEKEINDYHRTMMQDERFSFSSVNQSLNAIKYYYRQVLERQLSPDLIENPGREKKLPKVLSPGQLSATLQQIKNLKHKCMVLLTYSSGIRIGELLTLKPADLDFDRRMLHIRGAKGRKDRYTILSQSIIDLLKEYIEAYRPKEFLYEGQYGGRYSGSSVQKVWKRALRGAGISEKFNFHCLRHSFATHLLENGTDLRYIQQLLGHSSSRTTEIYTHVSNRHLSNIKSPGDFVQL